MWSLSTATVRNRTKLAHNRQATWSIDRTDDGRTCTCDLRDLSFCRAAWYFGNASATDGCFYQATAARRCRIKVLTSRSSPLMCRPRAYGRVLACSRVPVTTKESIRLPDNIDNRVRRAVGLERSWLAWFSRQTNTALITGRTYHKGISFITYESGRTYIRKKRSSP